MRHYALSHVIKERLIGYIRTGEVECQPVQWQQLRRLICGQSKKKSPKTSTSGTTSHSSSSGGGQATPFLVSAMLLPNTVVRRFFCSDVSAATTLLVLHCRDVIQSSSKPVDGTTRAAPVSSTSSLSSSSSSSSYTVRMGQSETAAGKAAGVKALGLWRLSNQWRTVRFPIKYSHEVDTSTEAATGVSSPSSLASSTPLSTSAIIATTAAPGTTATTSAASAAHAERRPGESTHLAYHRMKKPLRWTPDATALRPWMALRQSARGCSSGNHSTFAGDSAVENAPVDEVVSRDVGKSTSNSLMRFTLVLEDHFRCWLKAICVGCVEVTANGSQRLP